MIGIWSLSPGHIRLWQTQHTVPCWLILESLSGLLGNILAARVHTAYSKWSVLRHATGLRANIFNKLITVTHHTLLMETHSVKNKYILS